MTTSPPPTSDRAADPVSAAIEDGMAQWFDLRNRYHTLIDQHNNQRDELIRLRERNDHLETQHNLLRSELEIYRLQAVEARTLLRSVKAAVTDAVAKLDGTQLLAEPLLTKLPPPPPSIHSPPDSTISIVDVLKNISDLDKEPTTTPMGVKKS